MYNIIASHKETTLSGYLSTLVILNQKGDICNESGSFVLRYSLLILLQQH